MIRAVVSPIGEGDRNARDIGKEPFVARGQPLSLRVRRGQFL